MNENTKNRNTGTTLCIISLLCMFVLQIISFFVMGSFANGDISGVTASALKAEAVLDIAGFIAAWILAIVARVNHKNTFSLVLIIIYSVMLALGIFGFAALIFILLGVF